MLGPVSGLMATPVAFGLAEDEVGGTPGLLIEVAMRIIEEAGSEAAVTTDGLAAEDSKDPDTPFCPTDAVPTAIAGAPLLLSRVPLWAAPF